MEVKHNVRVTNFEKGTPSNTRGNKCRGQRVCFPQATHGLGGGETCNTRVLKRGNIEQEPHEIRQKTEQRGKLAVMNIRATFDSSYRRKRVSAVGLSHEGQVTDGVMNISRTGLGL